MSPREFELQDTSRVGRKSPGPDPLLDILSTDLESSLYPNTQYQYNPTTRFLDGVRGLASLLVYIQHTGSWNWNEHEHGFGEDGNYFFASLPFLRAFLSGGDAAVAIFFVLSGYVLSKSPLQLLVDGKREITLSRLGSAIIRRPFRLYIPPLLVSFGTAILWQLPFTLMESPFTPTSSLPDELVRWASDSVAFFNPFRSHGANETWYTYNIAMWTLPIELKGSMLVYSLSSVYALFFVRDAQNSIRYRFICSVLPVVIFFLMHESYWTMACFLIGHVLAFLDVTLSDISFLDGFLSAKSRYYFWHALFIFSWYVLSQPSRNGEPLLSLNTPGWYYLTLAIPPIYGKFKYYRFWGSWGSALLVYSVLRIRWLQAFFGSRPLMYLGRISFMLYLLHLPLLGVIESRLARLFGLFAAGDPAWYDGNLFIPRIGPSALTLPNLVLLAIETPLIFFLSDLGTRLIDTPSVEVGYWIVRKLNLSTSPRTRARHH